MTKYRLNILTVLLSAAIIFSSCVKEEPQPEEENPGTGTPGSTGGFTWTPNGGSQVVADSAFFIPSLNNILAFKNGNNTTVEITLSSLSAGTYSISSATGNSFQYVTSSNTFNGSSGSVQITANAGGKLSGTFSSGFTSSIITGMSGQFTDLKSK